MGIFNGYIKTVGVAVESSEKAAVWGCGCVLGHVVVDAISTCSHFTATPRCSQSLFIVGGIVVQ